MDKMREVKMVPFLDELRRLNLPREQYALFGSALLSVYNIRESKDLDIIVKADLWDDLVKKHAANLKENPLRIHVGNIKIFRDWMILTDRIDEMIDTAMIIEDIHFVRVGYVLEWKRWMGRPKDMEDIQRIEEFEHLRMKESV